MKIVVLIFQRRVSRTFVSRKSSTQSGLAWSVDGEERAALGPRGQWLWPKRGITAGTRGLAGASRWTRELLLPLDWRQEFLRGLSLHFDPLPWRRSVFFRACPQGWRRTQAFCSLFHHLCHWCLSSWMCLLLASSEKPSSSF